MWGYRGQWWWFPFFSFISVLSVEFGLGWFLFVCLGGVWVLEG